MEYKHARIRIDLGVQQEPVACPEHAQAGFAPGCRACQEAEPRDVKVPALEGFFVEILNPVLLPWGERKRLLAQGDGETLLDRLNSSERIAVRLITAWNLVDVDTGEPLPLPKDDAGVLDRAPNVMPRVMEAFSRGGEAVPKATATA